MKPKLKSLSKRTLSIILVLLMVVSTVTVGIFTTTAAYTDAPDEAVSAAASSDESAVGGSVEEDNRVGAGQIEFYSTPTGTMTVDSGGEITIDLSSYSYGDTVDFTLSSGGQNFNQNVTMDATASLNYTMGSGNSGSNHFTVKSYKSIIIKLSWDSSGNSIVLKGVGGTQADPTNWYVIGNQFGNGTWSIGQWEELTSSGDEYTLMKEFSESGDNYFAIMDNYGTRYNPGSTVDAEFDTPCQVYSGYGDNNQSVNGAAFNGKKVVIHFNPNSGELWVTRDQKSVAKSVSLDISPVETKLGKPIRSITATLTGLDEDITNVTYVFEVNGEEFKRVEKSADMYTCTLWDVASGSDTLFSDYGTYPITVTVTTEDKYTDENDERKDYQAVRKSANVTFNEGVVYYTQNGLSDPSNLGWVALANQDGVNEISLDLDYDTNRDFEFALSSEIGYSDGFPRYAVPATESKYCTIKESTKTAGTAQNPYTIFTYVVSLRKGASNAKLYIDTAAKKVYAIADFDKTTGHSLTGENITDKVRYYIAKRADQDSKTATTIFPDNRDPGETVVHVWNNSVKGLDDYPTAKPVKSDGKEGNANDAATKIYVRGSELYYDEDPHEHEGTGKRVKQYTTSDDEIAFNVYYVDVPIWATSIALSNYGDIENSQFITLNPNRIYLYYMIGDGADDVRCSGIPLDSKFWTPINDREDSSEFKNEASVKNIKTNIVKFNRDASNNDYWYKADQALSAKYAAEEQKDTTALYFGMFADKNQGGGNNETDHAWNQWSTWTRWNWTPNIAMRWADKKENGKNIADKYKYNSDDGCPYYASIWDLVGMHLDVNKKNDINGYYLQNTMETANVPYFDYEALANNSNAASVVAQNKDFPLVASTYDGITTYSYDSQVDPNRAMSRTNNHAINNITSENFVNTHSYKKLGSMMGYSPFEKWYGDGAEKYSFAQEFDIEFHLTSSGALRTADGDKQDIQFNFSGDDDVWVFVDGVLVLDLGGDHMPAAGSINFTKKKIYYKTPAKSMSAILEEDGEHFTGSEEMDDFSTDGGCMMTLDLDMILNSGSVDGKKFSFTDGATSHMLQMFYMERGENESNCSISFNLPQSTGLNVKNIVTADHVNPGLREATLVSANDDYFNYEIAGCLPDSLAWSNLISKNAYRDTLGVRIQDESGVKIYPRWRVSYAGLDALPRYPLNSLAKRVYHYPDGEITYNLSVEDSGRTPLPSNFITGEPGNRLNPSSSSYGNAWTPYSGYNYVLTDAYCSSEDDIIGRTESEKGSFDLLMGQSANFVNKIPANSWVKLNQTYRLDGVNQEEGKAVTYEHVTNNIRRNYYVTSYEITDDESRYTVKEKAIANDWTSANGNTYAADKSQNGETFFFSNYTSDLSITNPAMTVTFYNDVAVGEIRIEKEMADDQESSALFNYKVVFRNIFGNDVLDEYKEYEGLTYKRRYISTDEPVFEGDPDILYNTESGIALRQGEYALITGVPVDTDYQVEEYRKVGYSVSTITKKTYKPDYEEFVTYPLSGVHRDANDDRFRDRPIFNETIDNDNLKYTALNDEGKWVTTDLPAYTTKTTENAYYIENGHFVDGVEEKDRYYVNTIPIRTWSYRGGDYVSHSIVKFTNRRTPFSITFNYYPRCIETGKPASIGETPVSYTYVVNNIDDYILNYTEEDKKKDDGVKVGAFKRLDFDSIIAAALRAFIKSHNDISKNVVDSYEMFFSQKQAEAYFYDAEKGEMKVTNPADMSENNPYRTYTPVEYNSNNIKYHMNYISQPYKEDGQKNVNKWVSYYTSEEISEESYVDAESFADGKAEDYGALRKINIWLYNTPRKYTVNAYGLTSNPANYSVFDPYNEEGQKVVSAGDAKYFVVNQSADKLVDNAQFYYNQRLGGKAVDDEDNHEVLSFLGPGYGYTSYSGYSVSNCSEEVSVGSDTLKFMYWSLDPQGYSIASTDYRYYYRVTTDTTLYAVYGKESDYDAFMESVGIGVSKNGLDCYFDSEGIPKTRINTLLSPYNCPDYDQNILSTSFFYVKLTEDAIEACKTEGVMDELKVMALYRKYKSDLASLIREVRNFTGTLSVPISTAPTPVYTLDCNGYRHDIKGKGEIAPATLTNKNRAQYTTTFESQSIKGNVYLASALMKYNELEWIPSNNAVVYDFTGEYIG